jgi:site-specific DNA-cytosine methylase
MSNIISCFDGISSLQYCLNDLGIKYDNYYASEVDKNAIAVTMHNYPNTIQLGDVSKVDFSNFKNVLLAAGGSPCQNLSLANINREGINGEKSKLFFEFVRCLKEAKPKYFLYENVASMSDVDKDIISENLGCQPYEIDAKDFSAGDRNRYYWTNIPFELNYIKSNVLLKDIIDYSYSDAIHETHIDKIVINKPINRMVGYVGNKFRGNRVYNINTKAITLTASSGGVGRNCGLYYVNGKVRRLSAIEAERLQCLPDNYTNACSDSQRFKQLGNGWNCGVIKHILKGIV